MNTQSEPYKDIKQKVRVIKKLRSFKIPRMPKIIASTNEVWTPQTLPDGRLRTSSTGGSKRKRYASTKGFSIKKKIEPKYKYKW